MDLIKEPGATHVASISAELFSTHLPTSLQCVEPIFASDACVVVSSTHIHADLPATPYRWHHRDNTKLEETYLGHYHVCILGTVHPLRLALYAWEAGRGEMHGQHVVVSFQRQGAAPLRALYCCPGVQGVRPAGTDAWCGSS